MAFFLDEVQEGTTPGMLIRNPDGTSTFISFPREWIEILKEEALGPFAKSLGPDAIADQLTINGLPEAGSTNDTPLGPISIYIIPPQS